MHSIFDYFPVLMGAGSVGFTIKMFLTDNIAASGMSGDVSLIGIISTLTTAFLAALLKLQKNADKMTESRGEELALLNKIVENDDKALKNQNAMLESQKEHIKVQNELAVAFMKATTADNKDKKDYFKKLKELLN